MRYLVETIVRRYFLPDFTSPVDMGTQDKPDFLNMIKTGASLEEIFCSNKGSMIISPQIGLHANVEE